MTDGPKLVITGNLSDDLTTVSDVVRASDPSEPTLAERLAEMRVSLFTPHRLLCPWCLAGYHTDVMLGDHMRKCQKRKDDERRLILGAFLLVAMLCAPVARAAVEQQLAFTAPGDSIPGMAGPQPATRYEFQRSYDGTTWQPAALYRQQGDTSAVIPAAPGARELLLFSLSDAEWVWRAGGTRLRLRALDAAGNPSPWAQAVVAAGPDTEWVVRGNTRVSRKWTIGPRPFVAQYAGDTSLVWLQHLELLQLEHLPTICRLYGYIGLRGVRDTLMCAP